MESQKGTILPHVTIFAIFSIGFDTLEELQNYLKVMYFLRSRVKRVFDP